MKIINNKKFLALIISLIVVIIGFSFVKPIYESNDDMAHIQMVSGSLGTVRIDYCPLGQLVFISNLESFLYKLNDNIPWHSIFLYFLIFVGLFYYIYLILSISSDNYFKIFSILLFLIFFYEILLRLNYTKTALFLWFTVWLFIGYKNITKEKMT